MCVKRYQPSLSRGFDAVGSAAIESGACITPGHTDTAWSHVEDIRSYSGSPGLPFYTISHFTICGGRL